ncbi:MAG: amidase [Anaerolineae bacterium]|nr:amidase [Anaerolineae bacterium]
MNHAQLMNAYRTGKMSPSDYLSQIENKFSTHEPSVLAFLPEKNRFERLHKQSEAQTEKYPEAKTRPALFGMLVGVKDIFHVDDFPTGAGSRLPHEEFQGTQAESVTRLTNAGALIFGKTVTTEFAYFTPGPTRNPHNPKHTPGGSSSGSAAAVGAEMLPLALGTQTIGSLIRPASFCGVVGFKPSYDRISRAGVIPLSYSLDHIGFFTPDVATARQVASVLIKDWESKTVERKPILGIPEGPYLQSASDEAQTCFSANCQSLADAGYDLRHVSVMANFEEIRAHHDVILSAEAASVHKIWFDKYENLYSNIFSELIRRGQAITESQLKEAFSARNSFLAEITQSMHENKIDVWGSPSALGAAPKGLESTGDPVMNLPWTQIGFPALNLPAGKNSEGLPLGYQVTAKRSEDEALLEWAQEIEKVVSPA